MLFVVLLALTILLAVLIAAVLARFAEGSGPDNAVVHHSDEDADPPDSGEGDEPDLLLLA